MKKILALSVSLLMLGGTAHAGVEEGKGAYAREDYAAAFREWHATAEQGDAQAQYLLGKMYRSEMLWLPLDQDGTPSNNEALARGARQVEKSAWQLVPCGVGIFAPPSAPVDFQVRAKFPALAQVLFEKSAAQGDREAQYCLGVLKFAPLDARAPRDDVEAVKLFAASAAQGYGPAEFMLYEAYVEKRGGQKDPDSALRWLRSAAGHDDPVAQIALGKANEYGLDMPRNPNEAAAWFEKAQGSEAPLRGAPKFELGMLYFTCLGKLCDPARGISMWRTSAADGSLEARRLLGKIYLDGLTSRTGYEIAPDPVLAYVYLHAIGRPEGDDRALLARAAQSLKLQQMKQAEQIGKNLAEGVAAPERVSALDAPKTAP